jgi:hypothetical protein
MDDCFCMNAQIGAGDLTNATPQMKGLIFQPAYGVLCEPCNTDLDSGSAMFLVAVPKPLTDPTRRKEALTCVLFRARRSLGGTDCRYSTGSSVSRAGVMVKLTITRQNSTELFRKLLYTFNHILISGSHGAKSLTIPQESSAR